MNSGSINSAQFMPAIIDLPEKPKQQRQRSTGQTKPRGPYKKRKREQLDSSDEDEEYTPKYKPKKKPKAAKTTRKNARPARRATRPRDETWVHAILFFLRIHVFR